MKKRLLFSILAIFMIICMLALTSCRTGKDKDDETQSSSQGDESSSTGGGNGGGNGGGGDNPGGGDEPSGPVSSAFQNIRYLRIAELGDGQVTVKFNVYNAPDSLNYEIRVYNKEITDKNYDKASDAEVEITRGNEVTAVIKNVEFSDEDPVYISVRSVEGATKGIMQVVRAGGIELIPIKYGETINTVFHGETLGWLGRLFDEQNPDYAPGGWYFPTTRLEQLYADTEDNRKQEKFGMKLRPIIDLEYMHYVDTVALYYDEPFDAVVKWSSEPLDFQAELSEWDGYEEISKSDLESKQWYEVGIYEETRYIQVEFKDGEAPVEIMVFGYQTAEGDKIATEKHELPTVGEMMGVCGFVAMGGGNTTVQQVSCTTVLREYHNFGWSYSDQYYPRKASTFRGTMGNFDSQYKAYTEAGIEVIPCPQWAESNNPGKIYENGSLRVATYWEKFEPSSYKTYADAMFVMAARYGHTYSPELEAIQAQHVLSTSPAAGNTGLGYLNWIELGNEPNGEDNLGYVPYQLAALTSAAYDGHEHTLEMDYGYAEDEYHFGIKNADPEMGVAMSGLAGPGTNYIGSMIYWMKANRTDGKVAIDAFNFHSYFGEYRTFNGIDICVGVSPEEFEIVKSISYVIEARDKYYPEKEVWITEFGWDTNYSYETMTAAHAYANYTSNDVQAMWLTRAYLLFSACGIDKATMYMVEDIGDNETSVGKYGTCGIFDSKGDAKPAFYYMYTLKNTLGNMTFVAELDSGNESVWVYQYADEDGNVGYAVWCPTMDDTKVENFQLNIGAASATLTEAVNGDTDGVQTELTATNGVVTFNVSENPVYIVVSK